MKAFLFLAFINYICSFSSLVEQKPIQKIIYLKSNKEINVYESEYKNDFILKSIEFEDVKIKNNQEICVDSNKMKEDIFKKKVIKISPGGLYGFYDAGICSIIKTNYNLNNYIFSGASAGAWNSLFMSYKRNISELIKTIFEVDFNFASIKQFQKNIKNKILNSHNSEEFDLKKIYINVCVFDNCCFNNYIYTDFVNLEDAIDCCIASSNIPFLTGNLINIYRNKLTFDG